MTGGRNCLDRLVLNDPDRTETLSMLPVEFDGINGAKRPYVTGSQRTGKMPEFRAMNRYTTRDRLPVIGYDFSPTLHYVKF
jgi:hypothetical protein